MVPKISNLLNRSAWTGRFSQPTHCRRPNSTCGRGSNFEYSAEELDLLDHSWTWTKITFVLDIHIIRTKIINIMHDKMGNLSFPGNLFCIFPIPKVVWIPTVCTCSLYTSSMLSRIFPDSFANHQEKFKSVVLVIKIFGRSRFEIFHYESVVNRVWNKYWIFKYHRFWLLAGERKYDKYNCMHFSLYFFMHLSQYW